MKNWTNEELVFLKDNYSGNGITYCMEYLNKTKGAIVQMARSLNLKVNPIVAQINKSNSRAAGNNLKYNVDNIIEPKCIGSVYSLGYLWADGNINKSSCRLTSINLVENDAVNLFSILNNVSTGWRIGKPIKKTWKNKHGEVKNAQNQRIIRSYSQKLYYFLSNNGYGNKSTINFDAIFSKIPCNLQQYFILGLFDGDGSFNYQYRQNKYHSGEWVITAEYDYDWSTLKRFCDHNQIKYSVYQLVVPLGRVSRFIVRRKDSLIKLFDILYKNEFVGLERKYLKFNNYYKLINPTKQ